MATTSRGSQVLDLNIEDEANELDAAFGPVELPTSQAGVEIEANVEAPRTSRAPRTETFSDGYIEPIVYYKPRKGPKRSARIDISAAGAYVIKRDAIIPETGEVTDSYKIKRANWTKRILRFRPALEGLGASYLADIECTQCEDGQGNLNCSWHMSGYQHLQLTVAEPIVEGFLKAFSIEQIAILKARLEPKAEPAKAEAAEAKPEAEAKAEAKADTK